VNRIAQKVLLLLGCAGNLGPSLNEKPLPGFAMKFQIRHGLGTIPAFPPERLSDQDVEQIVEYLVTLRGNKG